VAEFVEAHGLETGIAHRLLDLVSEIGEVSKEVLKSTQYGKVEFHRSENWEPELGDVLFSLICVANATSVDLEEALLKVLHKYEKRIKERQDAGSGG
jgi:NTP pyrophosphatase (non-canonical NTP hydrolase)